MENSMQKQNCRLRDIFLLTWHHSAKSHLSFLSLSKFLSDQAFEFWTIIPQIQWLATLWVEPISSLLTHKANLSWFSVKPWAPNLLTALVQLIITFGSVTAIIHLNHPSKLTTTILSQNSEKPFQISVSFSKGFGLLRWTGEILNSSQWLLGKKKTKNLHNFPP